MNTEIEQLVANAKTAISILERNKEKTAVAEISNLVRQANRTDVVVMVCGEFKRGESSFINSLLETDICAVDSDIATASISTIKYGKETKITRHYSEGEELKSQVIDIKDLDKYTKGNSQEVQQTVQIEIELNNAKLKNGLIIIDSPGVGGMNPLHKHLTQSFIPQADIVLFMLHANEPMSDAEVKFYKEEVLDKAKKSAFIMNKMDANSDYDDKIKDAIKKIKKECGEDTKVTILPYSASLKNKYLESKNTKYLEKSNAKDVDNLIESLVSKYRNDSVIDAYRMIYNSLESIKKLWVERHKELANADDSSLKELAEIANKLVARYQIISNQNSEFNRTISKRVDDVRIFINTTLPNKKIEIRKAGEESIEKGMKKDEINAFLKEEADKCVFEIQQKIYDTKREISADLEAAFFANNSQFSADVNLTDEQKNKIQKYYMPIMIGMGAKTIAVTALGATIFAPIALPIAVLVGWITYKSNKKQSLRVALQRGLEDVFVQINTFANQELSALNYFVKDNVAEFAENIKNRIDETKTLLDKGKASKADQQKELARIVKHEIDPINQIQAEILRQSKELSK